MCTDRKALWGKFVICDIGLYQINWIELFTHCSGYHSENSPSLWRPVGDSAAPSSQKQHASLSRMIDCTSVADVAKLWSTKAVQMFQRLNKWRWNPLGIFKTGLWGFLPRVARGGFGVLRRIARPLAATFQTTSHLAEMCRGSWEATKARRREDETRARVHLGVRSGLAESESEIFGLTTVNTATHWRVCVGV